ncbi:MAG: sigma-70 family RNA polymerase sigma factor [Candidatus Eremiobacterota bacterium]
MAVSDMIKNITKISEIEIIEIIKKSQEARDKIMNFYLKPLKEFLNNIMNDDESEEIAKRVIKSALASNLHRPYFSSFDVWLLTWLQDHLIGQKISKNEFFSCFDSQELKGERLLFSDFLRGDEAASELYRRYSKFVILKIINAGINIKEAEDLVQEIFQIAFSNISKLRDTGAFKCWIGKISSNYAYKTREKRKKTGEISLDSMDLNTFFTGCEDDNPVNKTLREEEINVLKKGLSSLEEKYKKAIFLKYFKDKDYKEIAKIEGINIKSAYGRVFYGIKKLRDSLISIGKN